jgi:hypothetical protein
MLENQSMRCLSILLGLCLSLPAAAEVYRWVDADGKVHYSGSPPPQGGQLIELPATAGSPAEPDREAAERRARQQRMLEAYEYERGKKAAQSEQAERARRANAQRCAELRAHWRRLSFGGPVYFRRPDGSRDYLSDERRASEKGRLRPAYVAACGEAPK